MGKILSHSAMKMHFHTYAIKVDYYLLILS